MQTPKRSKRSPSPFAKDLSYVRSELKDIDHDVLAVLCSDIHLCHKKPVVRGPEPDWYLAMARPLHQLITVANDLEAPIVIAGDLFDRWNAPAELINFAFNQFTRAKHRIYAIPGQHDLPNHNYDDMQRSAYWTLCMSGVITHMPTLRPTCDGRLVMTAFPWGEPLRQLSTRKPKCTHLAVAHRYIFNKRTGYKGANPKFLATGQGYQNKLKAYDAAVFGDNHKGFLGCIGTTPGNLLNCGTFMRRKADEINYHPTIGLLHEGGAITRIKLDTSEDLFISVEESAELVETALDMLEFQNALATLGHEALGFIDHVKRFLDRNNISADVRKHVMEAVNREKDHL